MIRKNINVKGKIKEYFFVNPTVKLRVREIERALKLSLPSVTRYCKELEQQGILAKIKTGDVIFYTADRSSKKFVMQKKLFNIKSLYSSGLVDFLAEELSNPAVVVFGSYAKGEDTESSDIDLYIETPSKKQVNLESFENLLKRKIQVFRHRGIHEVKNPHLANNIVNGIVVNGFVEVFR